MVSDEFKEPELRKDGCSNTLTSVQKDNMVCVALRGRNPENPVRQNTGSTYRATLGSKSKWNEQ